MAARLSCADLSNQLNILSGVGTVGGLSDGELVRRFLGHSDGEARAAFTALVQRHGPMVLSVSRQILKSSPDVHDAFQATFLVLLRKAGSMRNADSVASWLHGVALRVARRARAEAVRRRVFEQRGAEMRALLHDSERARPESWAELHEEIARLPQRYREPLVLCYLEGLTTEVAAQRLGCPRGTILSRLSRGRDQLRVSLIRRGLAPSSDDGTEALWRQLAPGSVPGPLVCATVGLAARMIDRSATKALVSSSAASLASEVLRAMLWARLTMCGLAGLAIVVLVFCAQATGKLQDAEKPGQGKVLQKAPPKSSAGGAPSPVGQDQRSASTIFMAMPPRDELHQLLRRASSEAIATAKLRPKPTSWTLTTIAVAQAEIGDLEGARATLAGATSEATGEFGGKPSSWNLWRIGAMAVERGMRDEARAPLKRALDALPGVVGNFGDDIGTLRILALIAQDQALIRAREDTSLTVGRLLEFSQKFFASTKIGNARDVAAPEIAAALAALGDFDAAFGWSVGVQKSGRVLGTIAEAASKTLDRDSARRYVQEAADRLAKIEWVDETYFGWSDVAFAQARLGDFAEAKRSARKIGEGRSRFGHDMTDGQPYALCRIAGVQRDSGDVAGAKVTLRQAVFIVRDHPTMRGRDGRLYQIFLAQIANGDIDVGVATLGLMEETNVDALAQLARGQAAVGQHSAALKTFARALNAAGLAIKTPIPPDFSLTNLPEVDRKMSPVDRVQVAEIEAMAGNVTAALRTVRSDDEKSFQQNALKKVASARATAGDVAGALRLCLEECKTPENRLAALEGLARGVEWRFSLKELERRASK
jgi:RNA polymerase sigma factor (sigma-70 family)